MDSFTFIVIVVVAVFVGNCAGDQQTFKDCATKGHAIMVGGGTIKCEVKL